MIAVPVGDGQSEPPGGIMKGMERTEPETSIARQPGPPDWDYTCHNCLRDFTLPAAKGPTEEKGRTCPACGSRNIEPLNITTSEACLPGG